MLIWPFVTVAGLLVIFGVYLYFAQDRMVFYPMTSFALTPDQVGLQFEDVYLSVGDGAVIHGWYFTAGNRTAGTPRKAVVMCHGNAGNISNRLETAEFIVKLGADLLLWDYRSYGRSTGRPGEQNIYDDAVACFNWIVERKAIAPQNIIAFGESLGGAVAIELALRVKCGGLVVESSFTSAAELGRRMFPFMPVKWILRYDFDSLRKMAEIRVPVLVTHSPTDEIIPFAMGQRLFDAAREPKRFFELSGGHNDRFYLSDPQYSAAWQQLFRDTDAGSVGG